MSSVHELSSIIEQLELRVSKFKVDNPTPKQLSSIENQVKLIQQLQSIYDQYQHLTLYDVMCEVQSEYDKMIKEDDSIDGLIIKLPLTSMPKHFGYINFIL